MQIAGGGANGVEPVQRRSQGLYGHHLGIGVLFQPVRSGQGGDRDLLRGFLLSSTQRTRLAISTIIFTSISLK